MTVEGEDAFCVDINTNFRNGYKTRADASTRMSYDQISDVALSIEYVNQLVLCQDLAQVKMRNLSSS